MNTDDELYTTEDLLSMAEDYRKSGSYQLAIDMYMQIIRRNAEGMDGDEAEIAREQLLHIAKEYEGIGKTELALQLYDAITSLDRAAIELGEDEMPDETVLLPLSTVKICAMLADVFSDFLQKRSVELTEKGALDGRDLEQIEQVALGLREESAKLKVALGVENFEELQTLRKLF